MAMHFTGSHNSAETPLGSFLANLPELLGSMMLHGRRVICVVDFADDRYVQFWSQGGVMIGEVISNMHLSELPLNEQQEAELIAAGWDAPDPEGNPNYSYRIETLSELNTLVLMMHHAIVNILGQGATPELSTCWVKTWEGPLDTLDEESAQESTRLRNVDPDWDQPRGAGDDDFEIPEDFPL